MFDQQQRQQLLALARASIGSGLQHGCALKINLQDYPAELCESAACFVTLHEHDQLRGCIGSLQARRPLVIDVSENAYAAAFRDPRFQPVRGDELVAITISISVLTAPVAMTFSSEQDLLQQLQPGSDGLVLESGFHKGTFLPSVWEQLPHRQEFLRHLKRKAGLSDDYWSDDVQISRYHTESFAEHSQS